MRPSSSLCSPLEKGDDLFCTATYSFFDSYDVELLGRTRKRQDPHTVGKRYSRNDGTLGDPD